MQVMLYFTSLVLTGALSGFLAAYAWRQRSAPGARAYAGLALGECLLALAEILSMLGPTSAQALFWFKVRYLFLAITPVFWLLFALEYSARQEWLPKRLEPRDPYGLAGLFIIPIVTQALLWSNDLHGLWARQEIGLRRNGLFWIADTSARLPGPGFLAHSFYSLFLLLAGIALLLIAAWRMRRQYRGQALLVAGAASIVFMFAINAIFNLVPQTAFNPFTPGIGLSVLLIALAVFRFQFLKRIPSAEANLKTQALGAQSKRSLAVFLLIFALVSAGIATVGYLSYQNYESQFRAQVEGQLSAIAELKVNGLAGWRAERIGDAQVIRQNTAFAALTRSFLENPADSQAKEQLQAWLDSLRSSYRYDRVFLLDSGGGERLSSPAAPEPVATHLAQETAAVLSSGQVTFLDFHRDTAGGPIYLALLAPIFAGQDNRPLGLLVLRIDPNVYLYPYIQQWPVPSASAETLLVRREGADAVFLNELRFQAGSALNLRFSLENTQLPAVKAVLGQKGIVKGVDYRGAAVVADARAVPDSPWFLAAKVDTAEVYAPLQERLWQTLVFFGALLAAAGAGLGLVWQRQRARYAQEQIEAAQALRASEEKFRLAFLTSPDSVAITRLADGQVVSVNQGFRQILGYTEAEAMGKTSLELGLWANPEDWGKIVAGLQANGSVANFEAPFRARNGAIRYGLMSASVIELDGEPHILHTARDITERKRAEDLVRVRLDLMDCAASHTLDEVLQKTLDQVGALTDSPIGFYHFVESDQKTLSLQAWSTRTLQEFCQAEGKELHYPIDQAGVWVDGVYAKEPVIHNDYASLPHRKGMPAGHAPVIRELVVPILRAGKVVAILGVGNKASDYTKEDVDLVAYFADVAWEVAERKRTEAALIASEVRYRRLFEAAQDGILILDAETGLIVDVNPFLCKMLAFSREDYLKKTVWEMGFFKDVVANKAKFMELQRKEYVRYENLPLETADGQQIEVEFVSNVYLVDHKKVIQCNIRNITERKRAEAQILAAQVELRRLLAEADQSRRALLSVVEDQKAAEETLRESEERYRTLFENAQVGIYRTTPDGRILTANPVLIQMLGYSSFDELAARNLEREGYGPGYPRGRFKELIEHEGEIKGMDGVWTERDGSTIYVSENARAVRGADGAVLYYEGTVQDITERKQAGEEIRQLNEELEQRVQQRTAELRTANQELEAFAYSVSHDLRAPLRALDGFSAALLSQYQEQLDEQGRHYLDRIRTASQRMGQLINDLLDLSRVTRCEMARQPVDLCALGQEIAAELQAGDPQRQAEFAIADGMIVQGDAHLLRIALDNLLGNAWKFSGPRPLARIELGCMTLQDFRAQAPDWSAHLPQPAISGQESEIYFVRDNGVGFDMAYADKLFAPFQRLHSMHEFPGTGIGLVTVQRIVTRHGGRVWTEARVGRGATFYFTLGEAQS